MNILIVEDEKKLADLLLKGLTEVGFTVQAVYDGGIAEKVILRNEYDILIIDVILPVLNGLELTKRIRSKGRNTPILMLTALGTLEDKQDGFDAGVDDYLVKPFEFKELLMRINALFRRNTNTQVISNTIQVSDLILNKDLKTATRGGKEVALTAREYLLLSFLMHNKNKVFSRMQLSERVWDIHFDTNTNVVDVYINYLRKKIDIGFEKKLIHTVTGLGYILKDI